MTTLGLYRFQNLFVKTIAVRKFDLCFGQKELFWKTEAFAMECFYGMTVNDNLINKIKYEETHILSQFLFTSIRKNCRRAFKKGLWAQKYFDLVAHVQNSGKNFEN